MKILYRMIITGLLCFLFSGAQAKVWTAEDFPIPYLQNMKRHVSDPDNLLSPDSRDSIDKICTRLQKEKGIQSIIAVAARIEGGDPYSFGMALARKYGVGSIKNTGLIIVLSTEDRAYYILTGTGLEGTLPDAVCKRIENRYMMPALKKGDWSTAMLVTVEKVSDTVYGDSSLTADDTGESDDNSPVIALVVTLLIILFLVVPAYLAVRRRSRCPRCGAHAFRPSDDTLRSNTNGEEYTLWKCAKCGYTEARPKRRGDSGTGGLTALWPLLFIGRGGGMNSNSGIGGSDFGGDIGGSFGGGDFGGGGAGGNF